MHVHRIQKNLLTSSNKMYISISIYRANKTKLEKELRLLSAICFSKL